MQSELKSLWDRGHYHEIFGYADESFTALDLAAKYSDITKGLESKEAREIVSKAFATLNAPLSRQLYEDCRQIMKTVEKQIGSEIFIHNENKIWGDLWKWVSERWKQAPSELVEQLIEKYGPETKRPLLKPADKDYKYKSTKPKLREPTTAQSISLKKGLLYLAIAVGIIASIGFITGTIIQNLNRNKLSTHSGSISITQKQAANNNADILESNSTENEVEKQNTIPCQLTKDGHIKLVNNPKAHNPTLNELLDFLRKDDTNHNVYNTASMRSGDFATLVQNKAAKWDIRCGVVIITFNSRNGFICNIFETTDNGIVYIDCTGNPEGTGHDKIAKFDRGQDYTIEDINTSLYEKWQDLAAQYESKVTSKENILGVLSYRNLVAKQADLRNQVDINSQVYLLYEGTLNPPPTFKPLGTVHDYVIYWPR